MIETFKEFKENKNIDRMTLVSVLEESFRNVIAKIFGSDENFDVIRKIFVDSVLRCVSDIHRQKVAQKQRQTNDSQPFYHLLVK